ncbi:GntR family transcriptional regulator [Flavobacterium gilvum]|uniref:GntR family transcriptional regulator n=1 Tax=Flavobacterium gilvum TaxID=1492737 RepID=A0AAC9I757_9FLAO|nr:GntR family transcriptional regulator [Flavobacterium gilvum]AOW10278.1 GntR family transcriptional regulator [Flavobacterium gilvum]KFC59477.1 transcriptional regulator [Flavobacterium gilvum]
MYEHLNKLPLLDHDSKIPLHKQVEELLRELIKHPDFKDGELFPKEVDLAKRWGISRNTLRQAIAILVNENLLVRKKGSGTRVSQNRITTNLNNWMSFTHEMEDMGLEFKNLSLKAEMVLASAKVAKHLQLKEGDEVLLLQRTRSIDDSPMVYFESYFHPRIGISADENFEIPLYEILGNKFNVVPVYSQEELKAIAASKRIAGHLKIEKDQPVLERRRVVLDTARKPIEYNICYYRNDWFTYTIEIKRTI